MKTPETNWRGIKGCPPPHIIERTCKHTGTRLVFSRRFPTYPGIYIWQSMRSPAEYLCEVANRGGVTSMRMADGEECDWMPVEDVCDSYWSLICNVVINSDPK